LFCFAQGGLLHVFLKKVGMQEPIAPLLSIWRTQMLDATNNSHFNTADSQYTPAEPTPKKIGEGPPILRRLKAETGLGADAMKFIKKHHPGNPLRQIDEFFDRFYIPAATGRKRTASLKTEQAYRIRLAVVVNKLSAMNMAIKNLDEISSKQIRLMFKQLEKGSFVESTVIFQAIAKFSLPQ